MSGTHSWERPAPTRVCRGAAGHVGGWSRARSPPTASLFPEKRDFTAFPPRGHEGGGLTLRGEGSPTLPWLTPRLGGCGTPPAPALPRRDVRRVPLGKRRAKRLGVLLLLLEALSTGPGVVKVRVSAPARPPVCARWEGNAPAPRVSPGAPRSERWAFGKRGGEGLRVERFASGGDVR